MTSTSNDQPSTGTIGDYVLHTATFLQRGCNRGPEVELDDDPTSTDSLFYGRCLIGVGHGGHLVTASLHSNRNVDATGATSLSTNFREAVKITIPGKGHQDITQWLPICQIMNANATQDSGPKESRTDPQENCLKESSSLLSLYNKGVDILNGNSDPLNQFLASKKSEAAISDRLPRPAKPPGSFPFPAFGLAGERVSGLVWSGVVDFQEANPTTFITRVQIVYAALVYFWIKTDPQEWLAPFKHQVKGISTVELGVFIAYFPTYLRFHELFRVGAYFHPFDLISAFYKQDCKIDPSYTVQGDSWEQCFEGVMPLVKKGAFSILTPSMMEGSVLDGPKLPLRENWTSSDVHKFMGLGSILTIGLPNMPASVMNGGVAKPLRLYAYPSNWHAELPGNTTRYDPRMCGLSYFSNGLGFAHLRPPNNIVRELPKGLFTLRRLPKHSTVKRIEIPMFPIGVKLGNDTVLTNSSWASDLPTFGWILHWTPTRHSIKLSENVVAKFVREQEAIRSWTNSLLENISPEPQSNIAGPRNILNPMKLKPPNPSQDSSESYCHMKNSPLEHQAPVTNAHELPQSDAQGLEEKTHGEEAGQTNSRSTSNVLDQCAEGQNKETGTEQQSLEERIISLRKQSEALDEEIKEKRATLESVEQDILIAEKHRAQLQAENRHSESGTLSPAPVKEKTHILQDRMKSNATTSNWVHYESQSHEVNCVDDQDSTASKGAERASLKRKVHDELYDGQGPNKKMRSSETLNLGVISSLSDTSRKTFLSLIHGEILQFAGAGGLIDPLDFDVTNEGTIALSESGLLKAVHSPAQNPELEATKVCKRDKAKEALTELRKYFFDVGFWERGHISIKRLRNKLWDEQQTQIEVLIQELREILKQTSAPRQKLEQITTRINTECEVTEDLVKSIIELCETLEGRYKDRSLPASTNELLKKWKKAGNACRNDWSAKLWLINERYRGLEMLLDLLEMTSRSLTYLSWYGIITTE